MDLVGIFNVGQLLLSALVDLGVFVYNVFFVPLRDAIPLLHLPFISDILKAVPSEVWNSLLGDFSLVGLFASSGALIYVLVNFIYLVLKFFDFFT